MLQKLGQREINNKYYNNNNKISFRATPEEILAAVKKSGLNGKGGQLLKSLAVYGQELSKETDKPVNLALTAGHSISQELANKEVKGITPVQLAESLKRLVICYLRPQHTTGLAYSKGEVATELLKRLGVSKPDIIEIKPRKKDK